jgi:hypothetical protein
MDDNKYDAEAELFEELARDCAAWISSVLKRKEAVICADSIGRFREKLARLLISEFGSE